MINAWLGRNWDEVKIEVERLGKPFAYQITRPYGKVESWGNYRVVRVRDLTDHFDFVIAQERFSPMQPTTP